MGKSKSVDEKMKESEKFREFMDKLEADNKRYAEEILADIDKTVEKTYKKNDWDYGRLFGSSASDYQAFEKWSLERVTAIVNVIGNALKGGDFPSPKVPGSEGSDPDAASEAKKFLDEFDGNYDLVIDRIVNTISGVMAQFTVTNRSEHSTVKKDFPLAGGQHLFMGFRGSVDASNTFFKDQYFASATVVYEVYMSVAEAEALAISKLLVETKKQLDSSSETLTTLTEKMNKLILELAEENSPNLLSATAGMTTAINLMDESIEKLLNRYKDYKKTVDTVDAMWPQLDPTAYAFSDRVRPDLSRVFSEKQLWIAERYIAEKAGGNLAERR